MKIKSLSIARTNFFSNFEEITFSDNINLIASKENSAGKTTLIRVLLHALGFQIPSPNKIDLDTDIQFTLTIENDDKSITEISNINRDIKDSAASSHTTFYSFTHKHAVLSTIFSRFTPKMLENLLGAFYVDQEKGWTMLNRGTVCGKNKFSIENFIAELDDIDISEESEIIDNNERDIEEYKVLKSVAHMTVDNQIDLTIEEKQRRNQASLREIQSLLDIIDNEIASLNEVLHENGFLLKLIDKSCLRIKPRQGDAFILESNMIDGLQDNYNYIETRLKELKTVRCGGKNGQVDKLKKLGSLPWVM